MLQNRHIVVNVYIAQGCTKYAPRKKSVLPAAMFKYKLIRLSNFHFSYIV